MTHIYKVIQYKNTLQILIKDNYLIIKLTAYKTQTIHGYTCIAIIKNRSISLHCQL